MRGPFLLLSLTLAFAACEPNRSILDSSNGQKSGGANTANAANSETSKASAAPPQKVTVAELMLRVVNAPKDSFLFPCTLNAYSDADRENLKKLRQTWLGHEQDGHYDLSSSTACVCPGICVLGIEDTTKAPPKNSALLVIDNLSENKYFWLAKN